MTCKNDVLKKTQKQFTCEQANNSRKVTKCRWVIEAINGILKESFRSLSQVRNTMLKHIMVDFKIVCALLSYNEILENITLGSYQLKQNFTPLDSLPIALNKDFLTCDLINFINHVPIWGGRFEDSNENSIILIDLIEKNEWNKSKSIWITDVLKKTINHNRNYDLFCDKTENIDIHLQKQQIYESFINCSCGRHYRFGGEMISFVKYGNDVFISIKKIRCNSCSQLNNVTTKFVLQDSNPLYFIFNNSPKLDLIGNELEKEIEVNEDKYVLLVFTIFKQNHYLGVYNINNRLYYIDDLSPRSYKTTLPKLEVVSAFYLKKN
ncbi:unnamed protein product [Brachionus calyciflorus]|uniref:DDE Tnp4 domain-containing protein n=1 Tax=Brachionus calyciflorus TaxID=104777 RepID=A0A814IYQ5_9BILA|nr:unnamed protein product [Brachionus calyciflorus]